MDRSVVPINVVNAEKSYNNKLNSMMDHVWESFYTGQIRKSMFPALVETNNNYTVVYTGTQPGKMKYALDGNEGQTKIAVPYFNAGSYSVTVNDAVIESTEFDQSIGSSVPLSGTKGCGENRYVNSNNTLEFMLTPGCEVLIKPVDAILCLVRLEWTLDEFYATGGTTAFTDRVAGVLGIHASQIKVVAVYEGSVIVDYQV